MSSNRRNLLGLQFSDSPVNGPEPHEKAYEIVALALTSKQPVQ